MCIKTGECGKRVNYTLKHHPNFIFHMLYAQISKVNHLLLKIKNFNFIQTSKSPYCVIKNLVEAVFKRLELEALCKTVHMACGEYYCMSEPLGNGKALANSSTSLLRVATFALMASSDDSTRL